MTNSRRHDAGLAALPFLTLFMLSGEAALAETSGCSTLTGESVTLPQAGQTTYAIGAVPLNAGETLHLRMISPNGDTANGSVAVSESGESDGAVISGAAPQQADFTVPYDGLYGLQFQTTGSTPLTFEVVCDQQAALAPSTSAQSFVARRKSRMLSEETSQTSLTRQRANPKSLAEAIKSTAVVGEDGGPTQVSVVTSLQNLAATGGRNFADNKADVWMEARFAQFEHSFDENDQAYTADGSASSVWIGADYRLRPGLMIGAVVQVDQYKESYDAFDSLNDSDGILIGPYASVDLGSGLTFDARAGWGSSNNFSELPDGTQVSYQTERRLVHGKLSGTRSLLGLQFSPSLALSVIDEDIQGDGTSDDTTLGRLGLGSTFSYRFAFEDGDFLQPSAGLSTGWNVEEFDAFSRDAFTNEAGTKAEAGLQYGTSGGVSISATGALEGLGEEDYSAWSGRVSLTAPLN